MNPRYTKKIKDLLEKRVEKNVSDFAAALGMVSRKFTSPSQRSVPDRIFFYLGTAFFIEFKRFGQRPTESQIIQHEKLRAAGMRVYIVDNPVDGRELIECVVSCFSTNGKREPRQMFALPDRAYWTSYGEAANVYRS